MIKLLNKQGCHFLSFAQKVSRNTPNEIIKEILRRVESKPFTISTDYSLLFFVISLLIWKQILYYHFKRILINNINDIVYFLEIIIIFFLKKLRTLQNFHSKHC